MRYKVAFPLLAAWVALGTAVTPARASHCGACAYPDACCAPAAMRGARAEMIPMNAARIPAGLRVFISSQSVGKVESP